MSLFDEYGGFLCAVHRDVNVYELPKHSLKLSRTNKGSGVFLNQICITVLI
jgi:hypothetical protein